MWQRLLTHVLCQGRLQLVLEVGFAGRRKERHGCAPLGCWFDRTSGLLSQGVSSTLVHEATMTLTSRMRTGVKSATNESHIAVELNEGWPATACGAATFSFKAAPIRCTTSCQLQKLASRRGGQRATTAAKAPLISVARLFTTRAADSGSSGKCSKVGGLHARPRKPAHPPEEPDDGTP